MKYPSDLSNIHRKLSKQALIGTAVGLTLLGFSFLIQNKNAKLIPLFGALGSLSVATMGASKKYRLEEAIQDLEDIGINSVKQRLLSQTHDFDPIGNREELGVLEDAEPELPYRLLDDNNLLDASVHIAIFASSGSGKSFFLRWLLQTQLKDDQYICIDPHASKGLTIRSPEHAEQVLKEFAHGKLSRLIIGYGRDFQSICYFYQALDSHVSWRFANGGESARFPNLNVIVEELPAIVKNTDVMDKGLVIGVHQTLLTESRKIGIRLIAVTQGDQVSLLGLQGMSSLKSAYTFFRLGTEAIKYSRQKKNPELTALLQNDLQKSLEVYQASGSQDMFKGSCYMVDEDGYFPYRDFSYLGNTRLLSDMYDPENEVKDSTKTRLPDFNRIGENFIDSTSEPPTLDSTENLPPTTWMDVHDMESMRAYLSTNPQKVHIEGLESYWIDRYKSHVLYSDWESTKPDYIDQAKIERYFELRKTLAPSKAAARMLSSKRSREAGQWLRNVYDVLVNEGNKD